MLTVISYIGFLTLVFIGTLGIYLALVKVELI